MKKQIVIAIAILLMACEKEQPDEVIVPEIYNVETKLGEKGAWHIKQMYQDDTLKFSSYEAASIVVSVRVEREYIVTDTMNLNNSVYFYFQNNKLVSKKVSRFKN